MKKANKANKANKATPAKAGDKARTVNGIALDVVTCNGVTPSQWYVYAGTTSKGVREALVHASKGDNAETMGLIVGRSASYLCFVTPAEYAVFQTAHAAIGNDNPRVQAVAAQLADMVAHGRNKACKNAGVTPYNGAAQNAWANVPSEKRWVDMQKAAKARATS